MLFSSISFLWIFLPLLILLYYTAAYCGPKGMMVRRERLNTVLLIASLLFYGLGGAIYLLLLFFVIALNFYGANLLEYCRDQNRKKLFVGIICINFGLLFIFKYLNLAVRMAENLLLGFGSGDWAAARNNLLVLERTNQLPFRDIVLPIGISFYIFQAVSYTADVYLKKLPAEKSLKNFSLYISFFPQLIAGPIVQYKDVNEQLRNRRERLSLFSEGISRFCYGLAKKVILSNTLAEIADGIWATGVAGMGTSVAWLGAISYTLQIYFDFSGYSDMAIGLGKIFGFTFKENFQYPYTALSVQDFWRRWHISLSSWFREYVYIPLGGSRCSRARLCFNIFIVFLLTGVWHGANFTFLLWGLMYAVLLICERLFLGKLLKNNPVKIFNRIYTLFFVIIGWVIFRSADCVEASRYLKEMFVFSGGQYTVFSFIGLKKVLILIVSVVLSTPVYQKLARKKWFTLETLLQAVLLCVSIVKIISGTYNPFIYFQF